MIYCSGQQGGKTGGEDVLLNNPDVELNFGEESSKKAPSRAETPKEDTHSEEVQLLFHSHPYRNLKKKMNQSYQSQPVNY